MSWEPGSTAVEPPSATSSTTSEVDTETLIALWYAADTEMKQAKAREMDLRLQVVARCTDAAKPGTEHVSLPNQWKLTITKTTDYKLDPEKTTDVLNNFSDDLAAMLVKWKPELSVSNFKLLSDEEQKYFADCLTTKPSTPSLKLVPPKV